MLLLLLLLFSRQVLSDSLRPHGLQHARPPCPSPSARVCQVHVHWLGDAIQPSHPLLPSYPPAFNLSQHESLFQWVGSSHQVARYESFSISPSNEYSGLVSFGIGWFYLLAVQRTLKSLLQPHNSKASILRHLAFFMVQLSNPYISGKTIGLFIWTFVGKVMSLLFNTLSRFVIAFLQEVIII